MTIVVMHRMYARLVESLFLRPGAMALIVLGCAAMACGPISDDGGGTGEDSGIGDPVDAPVSILPDAPIPPMFDASPPIYPDANQGSGDGSMCGTDWVCQDPVDNGCNPGGGDICDDGLDNDCDGQVDEGCLCQQGSVQPCFRGPPGKRNQGACQDGTQTCVGTGEFAQWGDCVGGIAPGNEVCDGLDNSCNSCVDDHPDCCIVDLDCPGPGDMPDGQPFSPYVIDGTMFYNLPVMSWSWAVTGGPCDQLLDATTGQVSYTLAGQNTDTLTFTPTLSGDYTVTLTIVTTSGEVLECTFIVHIGGPGLRVELCWDTTGSADIDLHLHNTGSTADWATTPDDCYYASCAPFNHNANWGRPTSPLSQCENGPSGSGWQSLGYCPNPRLDIDNISTIGIPENINLDNPVNGGVYRTLVHYYGGSVTTHPLVNVYCNGTILGTYGQAPDLVPGFNSGGGFNVGGPSWRVVDVETIVDAMGVTTGCNLTPLNPPGMTSGYWISNDDTSY